MFTIHGRFFGRVAIILLLFAAGLVSCQRQESPPDDPDWQDPRWLAEYTEEEWARIQNLTCARGMVLVPGGEVRSERQDVWVNAKPTMGEPRAVKPFCMDRFEYPNRRYAEPRVFVSWIEAQKLCRQAGKRLCREDEWELACTMGQEWDYSYGPEYQPHRCNSGHAVGEMQAIAPAGSRFECRNRWGVFDLNGNVSEWVATTNQTIGASVAIVRGGTAWVTEEYGGSCWSRHGHPLSDDQYGDDGFRCCTDPQPGE